MGRNKKLNDEAMELNNRTYSDFYDRLKLLATNIFKYENLDDTFGFGAERFLENALYEKGRACFVKDEELGYLISNANPSDKLNVYNIPIKVNAWNIGYNKIFDTDDVILIFNNEMQRPTRQTIELFAYRLFDIQRTMDINLQAQKTPVLLQGDDKSILTLQNVYMQYSGNTPVLFGDKNYDLSNKVEVLKTEAPYLLQNLAYYKHEVWNECMTFLGIQNANTDKSQTVLEPEIDANNELVTFFLNVLYEPRKKAIDKLNEKYGLDIKLKINKDATELLGNIANELGVMDGASMGQIDTRPSSVNPQGAL